MKALKTLAALSIGAALLLTGCSTAPANIPPAPTETEVPKSEQLFPGNLSSEGIDFNTLTPEDLQLTTKKEFEFVSTAGTVGTIQFVDKTDPRLKDVEAYLDEVSGYNREYMVVEVDNREGSESANMYGVSVYDPEGMSYEFTKASNLVDDNGPYMTSGDSYLLADGSKELTEKEHNTLRDRGHKLNKGLTTMVDPLEKNTFILAIEIDPGTLPSEISGVSVMAHGGFDTVKAYNPLFEQWKEWKAHKDAEDGVYPPKN